MTLAYLGDSVMELYVRERLVKSGITRAGELNARAHEIVRATSQAKAFHRIEEMLTEQEMDYFRRGRNSGHLSAPRSATISEYRTATGMEVLFGYLHLSGQTERISELFALAYPDDSQP
jgi:ribonuclease-3 family protein